MFRDKEEELDRLNTLLEQEEAASEEAPAQDPCYNVYNNDSTDTDLEEFAEDVFCAERKNGRSLGVLAIILAVLTAVFCGLAYYVLTHGGFLG